MAESIHFYERLGFRIVNTSSEEDYYWAMLDLGGHRLMLNTLYEEGERPEEPDVGRNRHHGDTVIYINCEDVEAVYNKLTSDGMTLDKPQVTDYGLTQLYLADTDGYSICFQSS